MIIHFLGDKTFRVKTKTVEVVTGTSPRVGDISLNGPGEYQVGDIEIKGFRDAYLFTTEELTILYVDHAEGLSEETAKAIEEDIDVLLLAVDDNVKAAVKTLNDVDPRIAIPTVSSVDHPFCKEIGGCPPAVPEVRVGSKDLVEGERKVVVLNAKSRSSD